MKINSQKLFISFAVIFLIVLSIKFAIFPLVDAIKDVGGYTKSAENRLYEAKMMQSRKHQTVSRYNKYEKYLKLVEASDQEIIAHLLKELERVSHQSNLSVVSLSPMDIGEEPKDKKYQADFKAEGDIEEIIIFFDKITSSNYLIKLDNFDISTKGKQPSQLKLNAKVSMAIP